MSTDRPEQISSMTTPLEVLAGAIAEERTAFSGTDSDNLVHQLALDGLAYRVASGLSSGASRVLLERSGTLPAQPPAPHQPVTSSSLPSVEGEYEDDVSSDTSLAAASQAEDSSPVMCPHCGVAASVDGHACDYCRGYAHRPVTLSMPFDPSAR